MHISEVCKTPGALIIELGERCDETVAFRHSQCIGVLSDTYHHQNRANECGSSASLKCYVSIAAARPTESPRDEKRNGRAIARNRQGDRVRERSGCVSTEHDFPSTRRRSSGDSHAKGWRGGARRVGHTNPAWAGSPRKDPRCGARAVIDLEFDIHCYSPFSCELIPPCHRRRSQIPDNYLLLSWFLNLLVFRIHASRFLFTLVYINLWRLERPITIRYEELYGNSLLLLLFNGTRIANSHVGWFIFLYQKQMAQNS